MCLLNSGRVKHEDSFRDLAVPLYLFSQNEDIPVSTKAKFLLSIVYSLLTRLFGISLFVHVGVDNLDRN